MPDTKGCITVDGKKFHYLRSVLRAECGDMIYVRIPNGKLQQMTVAKIDIASSRIILTVAGESTCTGVSAAPVEDVPQVGLWLFQFIAKPQKMELIIRQAVECGAEAVVPVAGEFCQGGCIESAKKRLLDSDTRWKRIITEAREQSGSPVDTKILPAVSVQEACTLWKAHTDECKGKTFATVLYEQSAMTVPFHKAAGLFIEENTNLHCTAVMTGAEGGISPNEIELVRQYGFIPVHLKTNILRCETAALYGMAVMQNVITESGLWQLRK